MEIPTCNYVNNNKEYYVNSVSNIEYYPFVYGFLISISTIYLGYYIYIANLNIKKKSNKYHIIYAFTFIIIFLSILSLSIYKLAKFNIVGMVTNVNDTDLILPCYSQTTKQIFLPQDINQELQNIKSSNNIAGVNPLVSKILLEKLQGSLPRSLSISSPLSTSASISSSTSIPSSTPTIKTTFDSSKNVIQTPYGKKTTSTSTSSTIYTSATPPTPDLTTDVTSTVGNKSNMGGTLNVVNNSAPPTSTKSTTNQSDAQSLQSSNNSNSTTGDTGGAPITAKG